MQFSWLVSMFAQCEGRNDEAWVMRNICSGLFIEDRVDLCWTLLTLLDLSSCLRITPKIYLLLSKPRLYVMESWSWCTDFHLLYFESLVKWQKTGISAQCYDISIPFCHLNYLNSKYFAGDILVSSALFMFCLPLDANSSSA